jgi:predicted membrane protein
MSRQDRNIVVGLIIFAVGAVLLLNSLGLIEFNFWRLLGKFWPIILIIIGLIILLEKDELDFGLAAKDHLRQEIFDENKRGESTAFGLFGDIRMAGLDEMVGEIDKSLLVGDIVIDLTGSKLASGDNRLNVSVLIGDIDIIIPRDFPISAEPGCLIGSVQVDDHKSDGFAASVKHGDDNFADSSSRLTIRARALVGDIKIVHKSG